MLTFITGPVRAGKSTLAQLLAIRSGRPVVYCATAARDADDPEWTARIERHRAERPKNWAVIETAIPGAVDLIGVLRDADADAVVIVDSLGTWIADLFGRHPLGADAVAWETEVEHEVRLVIDAIERCRADVIVVSEEVGWGIVPSHAVGRIFRDVIGRANQRLCVLAAKAFLVVSGVALDLKKGLLFETIH